MRRREFTKVASAAAAVAVTGCGGGGGGDIAAAPGPANDGSVLGTPTVGGTPAPAPSQPPAPAPSAAALAIGANLTGMQAAEVGMRYGSGTRPNINYTVPRQADVAYLAASGYSKNRLPIKWEMLQPILHDTQVNPSTMAIINPRPSGPDVGAFDSTYESYITAVLDAHATAGIKCVIDLHNYCRYRDFVFKTDGSVDGLVAPVEPLVRAYTNDQNQVRDRIFALAPGVSLTQDHFTDFWTRAALKWKDHAGFGGYGLMNEPFQMPEPGQIVETFPDGPEDLTIWPAYAQAAINAIRLVDPTNPIYLGGNEWSQAMSLASKNPGWPLTGSNLIYEVHMYLDARSTGQRFDYDTEVASGLNAGFSSGPINVNTGVDRLKLAVDWAKPRGIKLALTETGMPIDDKRWQQMYERLIDYARHNDVEFYSWNGGSHWTLHNHGINMVPGWHQNKTLEPVISGPMKASAGIEKAALFDDGPGWAASGSAVTITVYARGYLASPVTLNVSSSNGGTLSKTTLTIPAGANTQDTFTFTAPPNAVATLSYISSAPSLPPPPPRMVYSLTDPVAYAATSLADAAMAIIAKYSASKWAMADGHTDYEAGSPAGDGQYVRAICDSGYGSSPGNAMEMLNWIEPGTGTGSTVPPTLRVANGKKSSDHSGDTWGFWCRKTVPVAQIQPNPANRVPYGLQEAHFAVAAVSLPGTGSGVVFQASHAEHGYVSELSFNNLQPQARFNDDHSPEVILTGAAVAASTPVVVSLTSVPGAQQLRVNSAAVASSSATFGASAFDQMLIGWGFTNFFPSGASFQGNIYSVITGKGAPTTDELGVLERYLGTTAI